MTPEQPVDIEARFAAFLWDVVFPAVAADVDDVYIARVVSLYPKSRPRAVCEAGRDFFGAACHPCRGTNYTFICMEHP